MGSDGDDQAGKTRREASGGRGIPRPGSGVRPAQAAKAEADLQAALVELGVIFGRQPRRRLDPLAGQADAPRLAGDGVQGQRYSAPRRERWFIAKIAHLVAQRLVRPDIDGMSRGALARLLFGLQRFPQVTPGLCVTISWWDSDGDGMVHLGPEAAALVYCSTRLEYFIGSHQLFKYGAYLLKGARRAEFLTDWASHFEPITHTPEGLSIEDLSTGDAVDLPPVISMAFGTAGPA